MEEKHALVCLLSQPPLRLPPPGTILALGLGHRLVFDQGLWKGPQVSLSTLRQTVFHSDLFNPLLPEASYCLSGGTVSPGQWGQSAGNEPCTGLLAVPADQSHRSPGAPGHRPPRPDAPEKTEHGRHLYRRLCLFRLLPVLPQRNPHCRRPLKLLRPRGQPLLSQTLRHHA